MWQGHMSDILCVSMILTELNTSQPTVGIVAAWGRYPLVVVQALKRQGYRVVCLGVAQHADPVLADMCDEFRWIGLGKLGGAIRYFRRHGVHHATMAGKFHKTMLFHPWIWFRHLPDWQAVKKFAPYFASTRRDRKDDTLLGALVDAFAEFDIHFGPATQYAPELLVKAGQLAGRPLTEAQQSDIRFGWNLAKEMGRLDVGQSVCVKDRAVMAVEAIEGTDACIRRAGELCRRGDFVVVKVAKPQQDMRFDVPTIGIGTLKSMVAAKGRVLAIEADRTILLDETEFLEFARRHNLAVVSLSEADIHAAAA